MRYCYDCEKYVANVCELGDCKGEPILTVDEKGYGLKRIDLLERIALYDTHCLDRAMRSGDFVWASKIMQEGHRGLDELNDDELIAEWGDSQDGFWTMMEDGAAPYELESDPMDFDPNKEEMLLQE